MFWQRQGCTYGETSRHAEAGVQMQKAVSVTGGCCRVWGRGRSIRDKQMMRAGNTVTTAASTLWDKSPALFWWHQTENTCLISLKKSMSFCASTNKRWIPQTPESSSQQWPACVYSGMTTRFRHKHLAWMSQHFSLAFFQTSNIPN